MEAFEHVVKLYMESKGYLVSSNIKFAVRLKTRKKAYAEHQTHGYEVDIVAAREESLVLGSVKSFLGSIGVSKQGFQGIADESKRTDFGGYRIFNDSEVRNGIIEGARDRYGYQRASIRIVLFVGKFKTGDQQIVQDHVNSMVDDGVSMKVVGLEEIMDGLMLEAQSRTYINDPVIMTIKALDAAGRLNS